MYNEIMILLFIIFFFLHPYRKQQKYNPVVQCATQFHCFLPFQKATKIQLRCTLYNIIVFCCFEFLIKELKYFNFDF